MFTKRRNGYWVAEGQPYKDGVLLMLHYQNHYIVDLVYGQCDCGNSVSDPSYPSIDEIIYKSAPPSNPTDPDGGEDGTGGETNPDEETGGETNPGDETGGETNPGGTGEETNPDDGQQEDQTGEENVSQQNIGVDKSSEGQRLAESIEDFKFDVKSSTQETLTLTSNNSLYEDTIINSHKGFVPLQTRFEQVPYGKAYSNMGNI